MKRLRCATVGAAFLLAVFGWTPSALAETHDVLVANITFTPASLSIRVGDTVRWIRVAGNHGMDHGVPGGVPDGDCVLSRNPYFSFPGGNS